MVTPPATAREAGRTVAPAAARAGLPATVLAAAMLDASCGKPVPARGRALRRAVHTARTPAPAPSSASGPHLLPPREGAEKVHLTKSHQGVAG